MHRHQIEKWEKERLEKLNQEITAKQARAEMVRRAKAEEAKKVQSRRTRFYRRPLGPFDETLLADKAVDRTLGDRTL
ncbi:hypothetical protein GNI_044960, partial [Gregarina niphandrodes]